MPSEEARTRWISGKGIHCRARRSASSPPSASKGESFVRGWKRTIGSTRRSERGGASSESSHTWVRVCSRRRKKKETENGEDSRGVGVCSGWALRGGDRLREQSGAN